MAGIIGLGRDYLGQSENAFGTAAQLQQRRNQANAKLKAQHKQVVISSIGTGAATGATIGSAIPAVGTVVGGVIGAAAGLLGGELF